MPNLVITSAPMSEEWVLTPFIALSRFISFFSRARASSVS